VDPGICGFACVVAARKGSKRMVLIEISGSECKQILKLAGLVKEVSLRDLFAPVIGNPVFVSAVRAGCHTTCPVPLAVLKAAEAAMEMALPKDTLIEFE
jgi:hypothetical protein